MRRRQRLWAPALVFSLLGLAGLVSTSVPGLHLRGEPWSKGLYVLALQLVVSALVVAAIDDLGDPQLADTGPGHRWQVTGRRPGVGTVRLRRAMWQFYLGRPLAAGLLALGLSMSLTLVAVGALDRRPGPGGDQFGAPLDQSAVHPSELVLGAFLLLTLLLTLGRRGAGRYGWVVGFACGVIVSQLSLQTLPNPNTTMARWLGFAAALMVCAALYALTHHLLGRRRKTVAA